MKIDDLGKMVAVLAETFSALDYALPTFAAVVGSWFLVQTYIRLRTFGGDNREGVSFGSVMGSAIFGAFLLNFGISKIAAASAIGFDSAPTTIGYGGDLGNAYLNQLMSGLLVIVAAFGSIAIFSAIMEFKKVADGGSGQGHDSLWMAFWYFIGGAICINLSKII